MKLRHLVAVAVSALAIEAGVQTLGFAQDGWAQEIRVGRSEDELRVEDAANREMAQARRDAQRAVEAAHKATEATKVKLRTFFPRPDGLPRHLTAIQDAAERYRDASNGAAKDKAKAELLALIDKYFEEDMLNRKQELAAIEARLAKLRAQLDRRREKKDDIVNLQYQVAVNEAEGLGFTSPPKDNPFNIRVEAPVLVSPVSDDVFRAIPAPPLGPPTPLPPPTLTSERPTLEEGATGELVEMLQRTLNSGVKPSLDIAIDSDFGPETRSAVEKFQSQNGLPPTGVVDAATWKALGPLEKSDGRFQVKSTP